MKFDHDWLPEQKLKSITNEQTGKRNYVTPGGHSYPSVTTVLSEHNKQHILEWRKRVGEETANRISKYAANRGTRFHKHCEKYLLNETPDLSNPVHKDMFTRIQPILDDISNVRALEYNLYSDFLRLAGTVDCVADYKGHRHIIDFKTSSRHKREDQISNYFMQAAAYAIMIEERYKLPTQRLLIIIAVEDSEPQVFLQHRDLWADSLLEYRDVYEFNNRTVR